MSWYYNFSLKGKLLIGFFSVMALTILIVLQAVIAMNNGRVVAEQLNSVLTLRYARVTNFSNTAIETQSRILLYINSENDQKLEQSVRESLRQLDAAGTAIVSRRFQQDINKTLVSMRRIGELFDKVLAPMVRSGRQQEAMNAYLDDVLPQFNNIFTVTARVREVQIRDIVNDSAIMTDHMPMVYVLITTAIACVMSVLIALGTASYCKGAISYLIEHIGRIESHDLSQRIDRKHYGDELGTLIDSLDRSRLAVATMMRQIVESLGNIRKDMIEAKDVAAKLSHNAADSESRTVAVAASADEMVATTHNISKNCADAVALAQQSGTIASEASNKVKESIRDIFDQAEQTKKDGKQIETMINRSRSIGSIVSTIDEIAAQTNLLALNAAIEAARAGSAGRGFAVVADEVRALASRTGSSTAEITQTVAKIEQDANLAGDSMTNAVSNMDALAEKTAGLETVLNDIVSFVNSVTEQITNVAAAAEEQTTATAEISGNMQTLRESSEEVASIASRTDVLIDSSTGEIDDLYNRINQFRF